MPKLTLAHLGKLVRDRRGAHRLRDTAKAIGISAPTLMRIENGRLPDIETFGKVCHWLEIQPGDLLGFEPLSTGNTGGQTGTTPPVQISAHFRVDKLPVPETANALARMLLYVAEREAAGDFKDDDA
jgi:DNA-binding Xre family transcriptional regulator